MGSLNEVAVETQPTSGIADEITYQAKPIKRPNIVTVIPAYNEARFIGSVVLQARDICDLVIVVDDGSIDNTAASARSAGATVVCHECNQGKGAALNTGFKYLRKLDPAVVVCLDGDGQHFPEEIGHVIEPVISQQADIVVGSRYLDSRNHVPLSRILGHRFFNLLTEVSTGISSSDSQSGFRAFSPRALKMLSFCSRGFSVESEIQFLAQEHRLRIVEVPVTIHYPDPPKRSIMIHGFHVLNGLLRLIGQHRPLLYFGSTGGFLLISGIMFGLWVTKLFSTTHELPVGSALITILLSMVGTILLSTGISLHSIRALLTNLNLMEKK